MRPAPSICLSTRGRGGSRETPRDRDPSLDTPSTDRDPPGLTSSGSHCSGQYTSYWNTFLFNDYYWPQRSCGQGNIFTPVCHSVHGGGVGLPECMLGYHPPGLDTTTPPGPDTPPREETPPRADSSIRSASGRYASFWNAFLFHYVCVVMNLSNMRWSVTLKASCRSIDTSELLCWIVAILSTPQAKNAFQ